MKIFNQITILFIFALLPHLGHAQATSVAEQIVKAEVKQAAKAGIKQFVKTEVKNEAKQVAKQEAKQLAKQEAKQVAKQEAKQVAKQEAKQVAKQEAKQLAKQEVKLAAKTEAKQVAKQEEKQILQHGTEQTIKEKSLSEDLSKSKFSSFRNNVKTAVTRVRISTENQYIKASEYEKFLLNPNNKEKIANLTFGADKDAVILRKNMRIVMGDSYKYAEQGGNAAHHIVGGGKASAPAREILERYGIDINDPRNGIFLPMSPENILKGTNHPGKHQDEYFFEVNRRLGEARSKDQCLEILDDLKEELYKGKMALQDELKANTILSSFNN